MQFDSHAVADPYAPFPSGSLRTLGSGEDDGCHGGERFVPPPLEGLAEAGLKSRQVAALILTYLLHEGVATGRQVARGVALPFGVIEPSLQDLKDELLLVLKGGTPLGDYLYGLSSTGQDHARRALEQGAYSGPAPVSLHAYWVGVERQSVRRQRLRMDDIQTAMADLVLSDKLVAQLGEAVNLGIGFFLYGAPGNGKTCIAQRITKALGDAIWIPHAVDIDGETIQLFDPHCHRVVSSDPDTDPSDSVDYDPRWVRIERPIIVAGGELTLSDLDITKNPVTGVSQAPLQMKSNCGTLVIDDFGRQRVSPRELLSRWIVPLEHRYDLLSTVAGRKVRVPFDQLVVFSSNMPPAALGDDAFLRRIPMKIRVNDPTDAQYRRVARRLANEMRLACSEEALDLLIAKTADRPRRFGHVAALLQLIGNHCDFHDLPAEVTGEVIAAAVANYFEEDCPVV